MQISRITMSQGKDIHDTNPVLAPESDVPEIKLPDVPLTKDERKSNDSDQGSGVNGKVDGNPNSYSAKSGKFSTPPPRYPEDDFDELIKRFEALKKR
jgi:hypothetical protein